MNTKEAVRRACKSQRAALSVADCNTWTTLLTKQIVDCPEYISANAIMAYLAMPKEANLDDVIRHALEHGKSMIDFSRNFHQVHLWAYVGQYNCGIHRFLWMHWTNR